MREVEWEYLSSKDILSVVLTDSPRGKFRCFDGNIFVETNENGELLGLEIEDFVEEFSLLQIDHLQQYGLIQCSSLRLERVPIPTFLAVIYGTVLSRIDDQEHEQHSRTRSLVEVAASIDNDLLQASERFTSPHFYAFAFDYEVALESTTTDITRTLRAARHLSDRASKLREKARHADALSGYMQAIKAFNHVVTRQWDCLAFHRDTGRLLTALAEVKHSSAGAEAALDFAKAASEHLLQTTKMIHLHPLRHVNWQSVLPELHLLDKVRPDPERVRHLIAKPRSFDLDILGRTGDSLAAWVNGLDETDRVQVLNVLRWYIVAKHYGQDDVDPDVTRVRPPERHQ